MHDPDLEKYRRPRPDPDHGSSIQIYKSISLPQPDKYNLADFALISSSDKTADLKKGTIAQPQLISVFRLFNYHVELPNSENLESGSADLKIISLQEYVLPQE